MKPSSKSRRGSMILFIDEVKNKRLLWDPSDEDYMDREATAAAWQDIADKMNSLGMEGDVKQKWKVLRDTYRRINRNQAGEDKRSRWPFYKRLSFLLQVPTKRTRTAGKDPTDGEYVEETDGDAQPYEYIKCEGSSDNEPEAPIEMELDTLNKTEDYDLMFLKSLAPYLRSLEPLRQLIVRNKIQDILLNELAAQQTNRKSKEFKV